MFLLLLATMNSISKAILAAVTASVLSQGAFAQTNANHAPSDLLLHFQNPGGSQGASSTLLVALGNVSTLYRDAAPGSTVSLLNIGSILSSTFGSTWFDQTTLWAGAVGFRGTTESNTLLDRDPQRTIYATKARNSVGTVGVVNSAGITLGEGNASQTVGNINQVKGNLEAVQPSSAFAVIPTSSSFVDDQNPFVTNEVQDTGYGNIAGGVQDNLFAGNFGNYGTVGSAELLLDLFRLQFRNDIPGQYGFGEPTQTGQYLGTIALSQNGDLNFVAAAVPEPSSAVLLLGSAAMLLARRRRNSR